MIRRLFDVHVSHSSLRSSVDADRRDLPMYKREATPATENIRDDEKVRLGDSGAPAFRPARSDPHKIRDDEKVRLGDGSAPAFGPVR